MRFFSAAAAAVCALGLGTSASQAQDIPLPAGATHLVLDVDGDGRPDTIVLLWQTHAVTVAVRFGDPARKPERFFFRADSAREDAVCRPQARLQIESQDYDPAVALGAPLPGFVRSKTMKAFRLVDGVCDSIHFYWNHRTQHLAWWRQ